MVSTVLKKVRSRRALSWRFIVFFAALTAVAWGARGLGISVLAPLSAQTESTDAQASPEPEAAAEPSADSVAEPADGESSDPDAGHSDGEHHGEAGESHDDHAGGHADPVAPILLGILIILFLAKVVGDIFERVGMPAVLGELSVGILLGNWGLFTSDFLPGAVHVFDFLKKENGETGLVLDMLARIGVILLLFEVGLESRVKDMLKVGVSSLLVAILGVVAPIALGMGVGYTLADGTGWQVPAFLGATLCATSVGITARVLKDLGRSQDRESKIILGAAVIDDVLGLIVLAVVSGAIQEGENFEMVSIVKTVGLSFGFLAGALLLGAMQFPRTLFRAASVLRGHGLLVTTALAICFLFSWAANQVQLAPIIGAFAAGLILEGAHYQEAGNKWKNHELEDALAPLTALMVPIFFVSTGLQVDLSQFTGTSTIMLAIGLTVAAIIGKQVCSFGVREKGLNKLAVGIGMIPRGEVGLIFASIGQGLPGPDGGPLIAGGTYSAIVVMVMVTTMVTPPLLKWVLSRPVAEGTPE